MLVFLDKNADIKSLKNIFAYYRNGYPKLTIFGLVSDDDQIIAVDSQYANMPLENIRPLVGEDSWEACRVPYVSKKPAFKLLEDVPVTTIKPPPSTVHLRPVKYKDGYLLLRHACYSYAPTNLDILKSMADCIIKEWPLVHYDEKIHFIKADVLTKLNANPDDKDLYYILQDNYSKDWLKMQLSWLPINKL